MTDMRGWYVDGYFEQNLQVKHITEAACIDVQHCQHITEAPTATATAAAAAMLLQGPPKHRGRVKIWQEEKGFGFIVPDDTSILPASERGSDLFVHRFELMGNRPGNNLSLARDMEVAFDVAMGKQGRSCAKAVTMVDGSQIAPQQQQQQQGQQQPFAAGGGVPIYGRNDPLPPHAARLIQDRISARSNKDFDRADSIRVSSSQALSHGQNRQNRQSLTADPLLVLSRAVLASNLPLLVISRTFLFYDRLLVLIGGDYAARVLDRRQSQHLEPQPEWHLWLPQLECRTATAQRIWQRGRWFR